MEHFFPQIQVKTKKKGLHQNKWNTIFSRIQVDTYAQMHTRVKLLGGGCRCRPYSNYWGDAVKLLGGYIPHPPRVLAPLVTGTSLVIMT